MVGNGNYAAGKRRSLRGIGVEQRFARLAFLHQIKLPSQIDRILYSCVRSLTGGGGVQMSRISCDKNASHPVARSLAPRRFPGEYPRNVAKSGRDRNTLREDSLKPVAIL